MTTEVVVKYEAHLVGPGSAVDAFEEMLDHLDGAVVTGDENTAVATLTFDVIAASRVQACDRAAESLVGLLTEARASGQHLSLIVAPAERERLLSRLRRLWAARV